MCFVNFKKAFVRVPRNVMEWAIRKKGLPEVIVQVVMILYRDAKTKVKVGSHLSEKILVQVGVHQGTVCLAGAFRDCDGCNHGECKRNEILYADDLLLISESIENLKRKFLKYKKAFESKRLKAYLKKTKVMASDLKEEILKSKVYTGTK